MEPETQAATELHIAKRYAELGEWQEMYAHLWNVFDTVPKDATVGWGYSYQTHDGDVGNGFGCSPEPVDQIQSVMYDMNDVGLDYIKIQPAGVDDE